MVLKNSKENSWLQCLKNLSLGKVKKHSIRLSKDIEKRIQESTDNMSLWLAYGCLEDYFSMIAKTYGSRSLRNLLGELAWMDLWDVFFMDLEIYDSFDWNIPKNDQKKINDIVTRVVKNQNCMILPYESKWESLLSDTTTNRSGVAINQSFIYDLATALNSDGYLSDDTLSYFTGTGGFYIHEFQGVAIISPTDNADSLYHEMLHHLHISADDELKDIMYGGDPVTVHEEIVTHLHTDRVDLLTKLNGYVHNNLNEFLNKSNKDSVNMISNQVENSTAYSGKLASLKAVSKKASNHVLGMYQSFKTIQETYLKEMSFIDIKTCTSYKKMVSIQSKLESQLKELNK